MPTIFPGLKAEIEDHRDWLTSSFGKYSIDELRERINFDCIMSALALHVDKQHLDLMVGTNE